MCLEDKWNEPFSFLYDSRDQIKESLQEEDKREIEQYQCDEPILKMNLEKTKSRTKQVSNKQFLSEIETVVKFEIYLSA